VEITPKKFQDVKAVEMCLTPNVIIPKKFRIPEFIKYTGI
jgi:hypothetical protein